MDFTNTSNPSTLRLTDKSLLSASLSCCDDSCDSSDQRASGGHDDDHLNEEEENNKQQQTEQSQQFSGCFLRDTGWLPITLIKEGRWCVRQATG